MENGAETIGKNFDEIVKFASQMDNTNILSVGKQIWSGAWYAGANQFITPSFTLDKCFSGWLFLYQPYNTKRSKGDN